MRGKTILLYIQILNSPNYTSKSYLSASKLSPHAIQPQTNELHNYCIPCNEAIFPPVTQAPPHTEM